MDNGPSSISFLIPGIGVQTINITSALPKLTDQAGGTTIDGYTQPGSSREHRPCGRQRGPCGSRSREPARTRRCVGHRVAEQRRTGLAFYNLRLPVNMVFHGDNNAIVGNFIGTNAAATFNDTVQNATRSALSSTSLLRTTHRPARPPQTAT